MSLGPRILAGAWRGRKLVAPEGLETRPTGARARQAVFDILMHAPWAGAAFLRGARVLDVFAGTGAYGLEALSRGAVAADFMEQAPGALAALRKNIAACQAEDVCRVVAGDVLGARAGAPHELVFLDPPYGQDLVNKALAVLRARGWIVPGAVVVAELGPGDEVVLPEVLAERAH
ncbi:RsmD family RNA methyltransferase, partial [Acidocella sp.]|uniref:RsmD family RNA methyltransferase n=1 Tax=Acidocella sp. TaxID=50710 RepID=UPI00182487BE